MFGMVFSTTWLEFKNMAQDPLVRRETVSASCNRRFWRNKNTAYTPRNIQPTVSYGGVSVMVWGCISHDCKLDLVTIQGNRRRLHEAETGSRLTNGSCAMSLNSNHVVLNTMPNVFVDVGLPTVDV
jgi:hypothetical protein